MKNVKLTKVALMVLLLMLCVPTGNVYAQTLDTRTIIETAKIDGNYVLINGERIPKEQFPSDLLREIRKYNAQNKNRVKEKKNVENNGASPNNAAEKSDATAKNEVELVVSSDGVNKEEATKNALRSAIEQTFGTFVSSNTRVVNDDLVKDEIATVASGNITSYEYISENTIGEKYFVSLKVVVSPSKLVSFCKSKGMEIEFDGAMFAMDVKMDKLLADNRELAIVHLYEKVELLSKMPLYDFKIEVGKPKEIIVNYNKHTDRYKVPITINAYPNANAQLISNTMFEIEKLKYEGRNNAHFDKNVGWDEVQDMIGNFVQAPWDFKIVDTYGEYFFNSVDKLDYEIPQGSNIVIVEGEANYDHYPTYILFSNADRIKHIKGNRAFFTYASDRKDYSEYPPSPNTELNCQSYIFKFNLEYSLAEIEKLKGISIQPRLSSERWLRILKKPRKRSF